MANTFKIDTKSSVSTSGNNVVTAGGSATLVILSILIANKKPIIVAPAMNTNMWSNPAVQKNYEILKTYQNVLLVQPSEGLLACNQFGIGKLAPNDIIFLALQFVLSQNKNLKFNSSNQLDLLDEICEDLSKINFKD